MTTSVSQFDSITPLLPSRPLVWTCRALCLIALCISGYLAWAAFSASEVYGCGGGQIFDCGHVLTSQYSKVLGIPVSVPAFALYASLLGVLAFVRRGVPHHLLKASWLVLTVGALSAGLAALWFTGIQFLVLDHLCQYCLAAHACGLVLAGIVLWKQPLGGKLTASLSSISMAGIAVLVTAQMLAEPPKTFTVERFDSADEFLASTDGEEFGAPIDFEAPIDFAPPGGDDSELFAPPPIESPTVDENFGPPPGAIPTKSPAAASGADRSVTSESDEGSTPQNPDVTSADQKDNSNVKEDPRANPATAALLLISPSTTFVLGNLLPLDDGKAKPASLETTTAKKPVQPLPPAPEKRVVGVSGNKFRLNTREWPLLGDPDAKYIFVEMFDYTCPHCRNTHKAIDGAFDKLGKDLAIIALPVPLDGSCNSTVRNTGPAHREACELARISVAVWRVDRNQFKTFHDWMFEGNRTAAQARQRAEQLVGKDKLDAELALPHAKSYITKHVDLYRRVGQGSVPKLMFPQSTMTGEVSSANTLINAIQRELGR